MGIITKMVINRNDIEFIYAEKYLDFNNNISYVVYHNCKPYHYSNEIFHSVYAEDKKYPLIKFINSVEERILEFNITNKYILVMLNNFQEVGRKICNKNIYNPSLWGYKNTFVTSLEAFNKCIPFERKREKEEELQCSYEEEYQRTIKQES